MAGGIYDYLDESTRFSRRKVTSHSYNFDMKVHHEIKIIFFALFLHLFRRIGDSQHCREKVTLHR